MLVLARRQGECFVLGPPDRPIGTIKIVEILGDKVRISFDGFDRIEINRLEVAQAKVKGTRVRPLRGGGDHG